MSIVEFRVNGRNVTGREDEPLLKALNDLGIDIPQVCYQETLGALRTCDTCFVESGGALVRACAERVAEGLNIETRSKKALEAQREGMARILGDHDLYCTVCENNNGDCIVHNTFSAMNIDHPRYEFTPKPFEVDTSHPFYRYDPSQCILCGRCVEACQNLQVNETLSIDWSLPRPRVIWDDGVPAGESSCVGCGHCVTVCPCNALMEKSMIGRAGIITSIPRKVKDPLISLTKAVEPATGLRAILTLSEAEAAARQIKKTKTVCTYCGVGCSFEMWTQGREILKVQPQEAGPANGISTCVKGKFAWDYVNAKDRLTRPLIRRGGEFVESSWEEALSYTAERLLATRSQYGPDAIGLISSSKCTNEESFLMQKLARAVIGTHNIDNCSRYCQSPATMGLWRTVGYGGDAGSISDIASAGLVLIVGSNTAESHPVIATRIKRAHKLHHQKLVVADLRKNEMAERADLHIHPRPGTDQIWLSAVTKYILDTGQESATFLETHVNGLEEYRASLTTFSLEFAEKETGISKDDLVALADMIVHADGVCALWAMGVTQHGGGSDTSTAISNLLLVTGNYARPGAGAYPLRGHNNVQGASDFGSMPTYFPGYQSVSDDDVVTRFEAEWGTPMPTTKGLNNHEMVAAIHKGKLRALYLIGEDMGLVDANASYVQDAFKKLDFFVIQDVFFSKSAEFADVIFPASPSVEKEGTFTNTERRIQRLYEVFPPLGGSLPDWKIITSLAGALGAHWSYESPAEILAEAARLTPLFAGVSFERLEGFHSQQWPVEPDGTDTPLLYLDGFHFPDKKARLTPLRWIAPTEETDDEYDLHLNNGRLLEHFHEGNMTYRSAGIAERTPQPFLEVSPDLAAKRGIQEGATVRLISRRGAVKVQVVVTDRVSGDELYLPMNSRENESAVNILTSNHADRDTDTPAYKELAVRMEVLSSKGRSPLPVHNFRRGKRRPRPGVAVEEKWQRQDYVPPPAPRIRGGL